MRRIAIWLFGLALVLAMALPAFAQRGGGRRQVELPTGPARKVILKSCTVCHGLDPYATRALDREGWQKEIASMKEKGAVISEGDETTLLDYLAGTFGPNSAPAVAPRGNAVAAAANPTADAAAQKILDTACTRCHSLQRVDAQSQPEEAWANIVTSMRNRGAPLTDADATTLIEYLGRTHGPK